MKVSFPFYVAILLLFSCSHAQGQFMERSIAKMLLARSNECKETEHLDSSLIYVEGAEMWLDKDQFPEGWVESQILKSYLLSKLGRSSENLEIIRPVLEFGIQQWGDNTEVVADACLALGAYFYKPQKEIDSAEVYLDRALEIREKNSGAISLHTAEIWDHKRQMYKVNVVLDRELGAAKKLVELLSKIKICEENRLGDAYFELGYAFLHQTQTLKADTAFRKAIAIWEHSNDIPFQRVAEAYYFLGLNVSDNNEMYFKKALSLLPENTARSSILRVKIYFKLSDEYSLRFQHRLAVKYQNMAIRAMEDFLPTDHPLCIQGYFNLGVYSNNYGRMEKALDNFEKALILNTRKLGNDHYLSGVILLEIAATNQFFGELEYSLSNTQAALSIFQKSLGNNHYQSARAHDLLGQVYTLTNSPKKGIESIKKSIRIKKKAGYKKESKEIALSFHILGMNYMHYGKYDLAIASLKQANSILSSLPENTKPLMLQTRTTLAKVYTINGKFDQALDLYQNIIDSILGRHPPDVFSQIDRNHSLRIFDLFLLNPLRGKTITLLQKYNISNDASILVSAKRNFEFGSLLIDQLRSVTSIRENNHISRRIFPFYESGIKTYLTLGQVTGEIDNYSQIFQIMEKSKGIILSKAIEQNENQRASNVPDHLIQIKNYLNQKLTSKEYQQNNSSGNSEQTSLPSLILQEEILKIKNLKDSLQRYIDSNYPFTFKPAPQTKIEDLKKYLRYKKACLVEYFFGDEDIFTFVFTADSFSVHSTPNDSTLKSLLSSAQDHFQNRQFSPSEKLSEEIASEPYAELGFQLYQRLLAPVLDQLPNPPKNLIIVPDGPISKIPFEALLTQPASSSDDKTNYADLPYLLKSYNISYAWSAADILARYYNPKIERNEHQKEFKLLAYAPSYEFFPDEKDIEVPDNVIDSIDRQIALRSVKYRGDSPTPLQYTKPEALALKERYGAHTMTDATATEESFWDLASRSRIIHIGAHGYLNPDRPEYSNIALLPTEGDSTVYDGRLHIAEIYNLDLDADLVVLPVCNSGNGKNQRGEGIQSLARAFRYAGCSNVVASQWEVDDESAMNISLNFYENLSDGMTAAEALRQAKLKQLREGGSDKAHPFYWAPMVLIGEDQLIELERAKRVDWRWILLGTVSIVLILVVLRGLLRVPKGHS